MRAWVVAFAIGLGLAGAAYAADLPLYQPAPAWVKPIAIPKPDAAHEDGAAQVLLQNVQTRLGVEQDDYFSELAVKIRTANGMAEWGNVIMSWRPDTETLIIHKLNLIRDGQVIDALGDGKKVTILRRETNLEMAMLDGTLTATIQPEGLQVGDILDLAYTKVTRDPVMKGRSQDATHLARPGIVGHAYFRALWPKAKQVRWRATEGLGKGALADTAEGHELLFDLTNAEAPQPPRGAPARFGYLAQVELTDFPAWADVSSLSTPLYQKAATLQSGSPLQAEIDRIKAASSDPKTRAMMALKLVEEKVRYLFLGLNNGGYVPADADVTWSRRFGDCKAKTALLLALLKGLGVDAQPSLVNTAQGDGLDERLPTMGAFDHVVVRAHIAGKSYWMDGTRIGDTSLDAAPTPNFHWTLPVQASGAVLEKLQPTLYPNPQLETRVKLDVSAGLDAPAVVHAEHIFHDETGLGMQLRLDAMSRADLDRAMRRYWQKAVPWAEAKTVAYTHDDNHTVTLSMDGSGPMTWSHDSDGRNFFVDDSHIGFDANFQREPGPSRDAPYAVAYPAFVKRTVSMTLPDKGAGFMLLNNGPVDQQVAGIHYKRTARLDGALAVIETTEEAVGPEFPASEASTATVTLREWANHSVGLRAGIRLAGNTEDWAACRDAVEPNIITECTKAIDSAGPNADQKSDGLFRRARAYEAQQKWDLAITDYTAALAAKPGNWAVLNNRGVLYNRTTQMDLAMRDYDAAIRAKPDYLLALSNRAKLKMRMGAKSAAIEDMTTIIKLSPNDPAAFLSRAQAYRDVGDEDGAIKDFDQSLKLKPEQIPALLGRGRAHLQKGQADLGFQDLDEIVRLRPGDADALNSRCWERAKLGRDLDLALADCNAALAIRPKAAQILDSRGLVHFRRQEYEMAIADFDSATAINPKLAASLYLKGLAEEKLKFTAQAAIDIAAAKTLAPKVAEPYTLMGLSAQDAPGAVERR